MQYDLRWEANSSKDKDYLTLKAEKLDTAEAFIIQTCARMVKTPEDAHYFRLECQRARMRKNQELSAPYWQELKTRPYWQVLKARRSR